MSNDASSPPPGEGEEIMSSPARSPRSPPNEEHTPEPGPSTAAAGTRSSLHYSLLGPSLLKAGQDGVDQSAISEIIYAASVGSKYFAHESKRDEALTSRISALVQKKAELEASVTNEIRKVDTQLEELEKGRDLSQIIGR
jgi:DNA polymerase kappa